MALRHRDRVATWIALVMLFGLFVFFTIELAEANNDRDDLRKSVEVLRSQVLALGGDPVVGPVGPQGAQGEAGPAGPQGNAGPQGPPPASFMFSYSDGVAVHTFVCTDPEVDGTYTCAETA